MRLGRCSCAVGSRGGSWVLLGFVVALASLTGCLVEFEGGRCGDGQVRGGEECDDGNGEGGDGCDEACQVEDGWHCEGEPSVCAAECGDGICRPAGEGATDCPQECGVVDLCEGEARRCAVLADGTAWCWGRGQHGQLGDGLTADRNVPVAVVWR